MKINPEEKSIVGGVSNMNNADEQSQRITWLVNNYLVKIASDGINWTILYQDPEDKRYWELIFPNSELQGGGPPSLIEISKEVALTKYALDN